jgi:hypothetical protein
MLLLAGLEGTVKRLDSCKKVGMIEYEKGLLFDGSAIKMKNGSNTISVV